MSKQTDLTYAAVVGFSGERCCYLSTSPAWYAFTVGAWLRSTGRSNPRDVRMSRGSKVHVNGMLVEVASDGGVERLK